MAQRVMRPADEPNAAEEPTIDDLHWDALARAAADQLIELTDEQAYALFDTEARRVIGMSGDEFLRRYETGEFDDTPDDWEHKDFWPLVMWIPLARSLAR